MYSLSHSQATSPGFCHYPACLVYKVLPPRKQQSRPHSGSIVNYPASTCQVCSANGVADTQVDTSQWPARLLPATLHRLPGHQLPVNLHRLSGQDPGGFPSQQSGLKRVSAFTFAAGLQWVPALAAGLQWIPAHAFATGLQRVSAHAAAAGLWWVPAHTASAGLQWVSAPQSAFVFVAGLQSTFIFIAGLQSALAIGLPSASAFVLAAGPQSIFIVATAPQSAFVIVTDLQSAFLVTVGLPRASAFALAIDLLKVSTFTAAVTLLWFSVLTLLLTPSTLLASFWLCTLSGCFSLLLCRLSYFVCFWFFAFSSLLFFPDLASCLTAFGSSSFICSFPL